MCEYSAWENRGLYGDFMVLSPSAVASVSSVPTTFDIEVSLDSKCYTYSLESGVFTESLNCGSSPK